MSEMTKRVEALIAKTEKGMKSATVANIRQEFEDQWYNARIILAKLQLDFNKAAMIASEHIMVLKKRYGEKYFEN